MVPTPAAIAAIPIGRNAGRMEAAALNPSAAPAGVGTATTHSSTVHAIATTPSALAPANAVKPRPSTAVPTRASTGAVAGSRWQPAAARRLTPKRTAGHTTYGRSVCGAPRNQHHSTHSPNAAPRARVVRKYGKMRLARAFTCAGRARGVALQ